MATKICPRCKKNADDPKFALCSPCRQYVRDAAQQRRAAFQNGGLCMCGALLDTPGKCCSRCLARAQEIRDAAKAEVFEKYGSQCVCCGETDESFLAVDHIRNDGGAQRRAQLVPNIYLFLQRNNFPEGFQILCINCNTGKFRNYGQCPHKGILPKQREETTYTRWREKVKSEILRRYGSECFCCGETNPLFLSVDHIDGGGTQHRKREKSGDMTVILHRMGYPEGFRIACMNCNQGAYINGGVCPHQEKGIYNV